MKVGKRIGFLSGLAVGVVAGLGVFVVGGGALFAQPTTTAPTAGPPTHEEMHAIMDAMHGEGTSDRMHQAMAEGIGMDGEALMEQCVAMTAMMGGSGGMMGR
ncbi:MAG: hypothetical protein HY681_12000 [Chloroflexi bacterium]|nr:hypothetical protein [Chloroflexota bacterium]